MKIKDFFVFSYVKKLVFNEVVSSSAPDPLTRIESDTEHFISFGLVKHTKACWFNLQSSPADAKSDKRAIMKFFYWRHWRQRLNLIFSHFSLCRLLLEKWQSSKAIKIQLLRINGWGQSGRKYQNALTIFPRSSCRSNFLKFSFW